MTNFDELPDSALLRLRDLIAPKGPVPASRSSLYAWVAEGRFPRPVKLSIRMSAWRVGEVRDWLASLRTNATEQPSTARRQQ